MLLIAGEKDDGCPAIEAGKMYRALATQGKKAGLAVYPGEGHILQFWSHTHVVDAVTRILEFLDAELK
jgi:dipeptidyl aminopeptidase/acylaminoacyl peptidase